MSENLGATHVIDQIQKHLSPLFTTEINTVVYSSKEHDCLRSGDPVGAVEVENLLLIYPFTAKRSSFSRTTYPVTQWAIDVLVDDSDPEVGMFGWEPCEHGEYVNLGDALKEVARLVAAHHVEGSLSAECEAESLSLYG